VGDCLLCVAATLEQCTHSVPYVPADDVAAGPDDLAGDLAPGDVRRTIGRREVALALQPVDLVSACRPDADDDIGGAGSG
jgi:hypothetical protein